MGRISCGCSCRRGRAEGIGEGRRGGWEEVGTDLCGFCEVVSLLRLWLGGILTVLASVSASRWVDEW
jgi:hypothetical protein